jgi:DNA-binding transcriptional ArsR family regulator
MTLPELISDPIRARIFLEAILNEEVTAQELMEKIAISRSTMSHHLSRFVEDRVFKVRVQETGRLVKFYRYNPDFQEEICLECIEDANVTKQIMFLESAYAHLQVVSGLLIEMVKKTRSMPAKPKRGHKVTFTFNLMSKEEADIWNEEYVAFQKRFEERRKSMMKSSESLDFIGYGGIIPTR